MPVIGRLDKQVEDVLINPVSKRQDGEGSPRDPDEETDSGRPPRATERPATPQRPRTGESSAGPGELPVWLL